MTNPYCKGRPDRHLACHDSCEKFKAWRKAHAAERAFTGLRETRFGMQPVEITRPPQSWCYMEDGE